MPNLKLIIVGQDGLTHVGGSFRRAALKHGLDVVFFDIRESHSKYSIINSLLWRLTDHKPAKLRFFSSTVAAYCKNHHPNFLLTTGSAPLMANDLRIIKQCETITANFSTDDPWADSHRSRWQLDSLASYDFIFTPRLANLDEFNRLTRRNVYYLPFGYDNELSYQLSDTIQCPSESHDVLFVGGADRDRIELIKPIINAGLKIGLVGGYWDQNPVTQPFALGIKAPVEINRLTKNAKINLCLVRRSNRDGHVMRSFEIAACGGCMVVEDTKEHRNIFGADGVTVRYFSKTEDAISIIRELLINPAERARMGMAVFQRITSGRHTYEDRLETILKTVSLDSGRNPL